MHLNKNLAGLALGALLAFMHLVWALMVLFGWAQGFLDWIFSLHMITPVFTIAPFDWGSAIVLLIVTFICGYIAGWIFAWIWNRLHRA